MISSQNILGTASKRTLGQILFLWLTFKHRTPFQKGTLSNSISVLCKVYMLFGTCMLCKKVVQFSEINNYQMVQHKLYIHTLDLLNNPYDEL